MPASYDSSFLLFKERVGGIGDPQSVVSRPPRHDDQLLGPSIFRMLVEDVRLEDVTLPGLFVGRSEVRRLSFRGSDLHLSTFNWSLLDD
jgi:hypothetical protein